jgi:hypothetical protein
VTRIGTLGKTLAACSVHRLLVTVIVPSSSILITLMMEALHSSETSVLTEYGILHILKLIRIPRSEEMKLQIHTLKRGLLETLDKTRG